MQGILIRSRAQTIEEDGKATIFSVILKNIILLVNSFHRLENRMAKL